jgi:hypothetical protein
VKDDTEQTAVLTSNTQAKHPNFKTEASVTPASSSKAGPQTHRAQWSANVASSIADKQADVLQQIAKMRNDQKTAQDAADHQAQREEAQEARAHELQMMQMQLQLASYEQRPVHGNGYGQYFPPVSNYQVFSATNGMAGVDGVNVSGMDLGDFGISALDAEGNGSLGHGDTNLLQQLYDTDHSGDNVTSP